MILRGFLALLAPFAGSALAEGFLLDLPIDCDLGQTCYIQQYVDHDPSEAAQDYRCAGLSYDGHNGTDFALPHLAMMQQGVPVLAAARGVVVGLRDGMADEVYSQANAQKVKGRECGNGVVLRHAGGWETQYCHLKSGSLTVEKGDRVAAGTPLGQVGMSGRAAFPHLHLSVRKDGKPVDPFVPSGKTSCSETPSQTLWRDPPPYRAGGLLLSGFADQVPDYSEVKAGTANTRLSAKSANIVAFSFGFGFRKGDILDISITGPKGLRLSKRHHFDKAKALAFRAIGQKRRRAPWPTGDYSGRAVLIRGGAEISSHSWTATIAD
ncbi:M23 family metallopeptidase [Sulfitobacter mediterraneus]|uniref:M23 family metallopeptidase n=1 Tax=Sulfitobacter mediterraneus TaxID=83219 RepID=UPI00193A9FE4|nr:M23 family metallopeptidase [Sulfitobacter mediterraneus]MBM1556016.1 M23 family metallopeptidase [Sulfitobacter mediterraneus]MBM1567946.1 M23 family metallopeptidase [Sulfitobacter mediterraneus]MBM1571370.1 M23 family metallopeptidase [Sulfitobacter mediterraneus]MBM1575158.1 M23 family metallopeptidase [Sulfitobacter mediterraneus]MBM1579351.1 M23 family metallopeptidase [Sulfitobacter mediterraneus]